MEKLKAILRFDKGEKDQEVDKDLGQEDQIKDKETKKMRDKSNY